MFARSPGLLQCWRGDLFPLLQRGLALNLPNQIGLDLKGMGSNTLECVWGYLCDDLFFLYSFHIPMIYLAKVAGFNLAGYSDAIHKRPLDF